MRVWSRIALVVIALCSTSALVADHFSGQCPLTLADSTPAESSFDLSPHGVFRSGSLVHALRGQVLTTYTTNDVGTLQISSEQRLDTLAARETEGGVAFAGTHLYVSSEAGLEVFNLANVGVVSGAVPVRVARVPGLHYRRITISGNRLAGLYPTTDLPCYPRPGAANACPAVIEIVDIANPANPVRLAAINSFPTPSFRGFNDIAFNSGVLITVTEEAVVALDITNPFSPRIVASVQRPGKWLVSNGSNFLAVGRDTEIDVYNVSAGVAPFFTRTKLLPIPSYLTIERGNNLRFSRNASWDETNLRLTTLINEVDPQTLQPARTIAFDVFDFTVLQLEGSAERIYEQVSMVHDDEVKHNPLAFGAYVYVVGEETGIQTYGSCGVAAGRIELDSPYHLICGAGRIHGWVTGQQKINSVEILLNNQFLGLATLGGPLRSEVSSPTPVTPWRIDVNLDNLPRGDYQLRAVATDALNVRRQFAMKWMFFEGPGQNCSQARRRSVR